MSSHASGHTDWQAPANRGVPVVTVPPTEAVAPPPRPPVTGWSPTSWRSKRSER